MRDQFNRTAGTDVLDYCMGAGAQGEQAVPSYKRFLCDRWRTIYAELFRYSSMIDPVILDECGIFFVQADRYIQFSRGFHCAGRETLHFSVECRRQ